MFTAELSNTLWLHFPSCFMLSLISARFPSSYLFASGFSCLIGLLKTDCISVSCFPYLAWFSGREGYLKKAAYSDIIKSEVTVSLRPTWRRCHISMKPPLITVPAHELLLFWTLGRHSFVAPVLLSNTLC